MIPSSTIRSVLVALLKRHFPESPASTVLTSSKVGATASGGCSCFASISAIRPRVAAQSLISLTMVSMLLASFVCLREADEFFRQMLRYHADCREQGNHLFVPMVHGRVLLSGGLSCSL